MTLRIGFNRCGNDTAVIISSGKTDICKWSNDMTGNGMTVAFICHFRSIRKCKYNSCSGFLILNTSEFAVI